MSQKGKHEELKISNIELADLYPKQLGSRNVFVAKIGNEYTMSNGQVVKPILFVQGTTSESRTKYQFGWENMDRCVLSFDTKLVETYQFREGTVITDRKISWTDSTVPNGKNHNPLSDRDGQPILSSDNALLYRTYELSSLSPSAQQQQVTAVGSRMQETTAPHVVTEVAAIVQ